MNRCEWVVYKVLVLGMVLLVFGGAIVVFVVVPSGILARLLAMVGR